MGSIAGSQPLANGHRPTVDELKLELRGKPGQETLQAPLPNPSLQVTADHNLKAVEAPVYAPRAGEVLLHIKATGICGYVLSIARAISLGISVFLLLNPPGLAGQTCTSGKRDASEVWCLRAIASSATRLLES